LVRNKEQHRCGDGEVDHRCSREHHADGNDHEEIEGVRAEDIRDADDAAFTVGGLDAHQQIGEAGRSRDGDNTPQKRRRPERISKHQDCVDEPFDSDEDVEDGRPHDCADSEVERPSDGCRHSPVPESSIPLLQ